MHGINIAKAVQKKKSEKVVKDDLQKTKKSYKKSEKEKVQRTYPKNEFITFHSGKKESTGVHQESKTFISNEKIVGSKTRAPDEIKEIKPEFKNFNLEETSLPPGMISFPRVTLEDTQSGKCLTKPEFSTFDFATRELKPGEVRPLGLFQSEIPFITLDQIPEGGGKFGKMRVYDDNSAELEVNGVVYEISPMVNQKMEAFAISPHPSEIAFEMTSLGKIGGTFNITYPKEKF